MADNLIKLTIGNGYVNTIALKVKLEKKGINLKSEYRGYNFEQKAQMANEMFNAMKNEAENLKSIIKEKGLKPNERWHSLPKSIKLLTYVNFYIVSLKAYLESLAKFITRILHDCSSSDLAIVNKIHQDKYKNLDYFINCGDEINLIKTIRDVFLHSDDKQELHIAFEQTEDSKLELVLMMAVFDEDRPSEKVIMSYSEINQAVMILSKIYPNFLAAVNKSLN